MASFCFFFCDGDGIKGVWESADAPEDVDDAEEDDDDESPNLRYGRLLIIGVSIILSYSDIATENSCGYGGNDG